MALIKLQINYCVICKESAGTELYLCDKCSTDGAELPVQYRFDHAYYCVHCSKVLDRYYDFYYDGTFKSEDYRCIGCDTVAQWPNFDHRKHTDWALRYKVAMLKTGDLPIHVRQAYERQLRTMTSLEHLRVD